MESIRTIFSTQQALEFHPYSVLHASYDSHKKQQFLIEYFIICFTYFAIMARQP